jgi:NADH:ubiquinone reductase (H+-translocating)
MAYRREIISEGRSVQLPAAKPRVKPKRGEVPHIVVVGGGVAGIILATRLGRLLGRRGRARVSLIDRSWIHVWKPMLHTFAAGAWNIYQQQVQFVAHARMHYFEYIPGQRATAPAWCRRARGDRHPQPPRLPISRPCI